MHPIGIAPSILAADFARLGAEVAEVAPVVEWVHVDVMDGHYVPNLSLGVPVVASLRRATDLRLDCHLMITDPSIYAPRFVALGVESVTFHPEVEEDPRALVDRLHDLGAEVGVALKPAHPLDDVLELLPHVDLLLVMSVEPGFGGQAFQSEVLPKVAAAAAWRAANAAGFRIQIDGGIGPDTVAAAAAAGAELLVAGSAVFGTEDRVAAAARRPCASPNPTVGCTVLDEHEVLGSGTSEPAGGRHAEVAALAEAGERARGATAVITLEPCAHHGRTPPCTEALLGAGIARVVFARTDPNPLATGGARAMRAAGIEVIGPLVPDDLLARAVDLELAGTGTSHRLGRPFVTLKLAQRSDGGLVATDGSRWITGARARRAVHRDRDRVDAVLVGVGTVLADDPLLDARDLDVSAPDGIPVLPRPPRAVVLDSEARTPPSARVVRPGSLLLVAPDAPVERVAQLRHGGASLREVPRGPGGLDPVAALGVLVEEGITTVLAEPGPTLAASLMAAGLVDRLVLHVAGSAPDVAVPALALDGWRLVRRGGAGPDRIIELVRQDVGPHAVAEAA